MYLESKAYDFAQKIINLLGDEKGPEKIDSENNEESIQIDETIKDPKRIIGGTDYKKYENMVNEFERQENLKKRKENEILESKKNALKIGCNNDLRKERQLMDKPVKDKIEASKIFKKEGDDLIIEKKYKEAIDSYEKGLLQLFYSFSDDSNEEEEIDKIKEAINLNCSMCLIKLNDFDKAIGYLNEAERINPENLKCIYRTAFCYYKLEKFNESKKIIEKALAKNIKENDKKLFKDLKNDIEKEEKCLEEKENNFYKKIINKK